MSDAQKNKEVEFKFLVKNDTWKQYPYTAYNILQAYFTENKFSIYVNIDTNNNAQIISRKNNEILFCINIPFDDAVNIRKLFGSELVSQQDLCSVRLRLKNKNNLQLGFITIKSKNPGAERDEFEYPLSPIIVEDIIRNKLKNPIIKIRHEVIVDNNKWEIDEFKGVNAGLIIAELEIDKCPDVIPSFIDLEVTNDIRYYNQDLSEKPYSQWL